MADESLSKPAAVNPGSAGTAATASQPGNSTEGKSLGVVGKILAKLPGKKRGPKGPWKHKKEAGEVDESPAPGVVSAPPAEIRKVVLPAGFLKKTVVQGISIPDEMFVRRCYSRVFRVSGDDKLARSLAADAAVMTSEKEMLGDSVEALFAKYGWSDTWGPEIGLAVVVISIGSRWARIEKKLDQLELARKAVGKGTNATSGAQPQQAPGDGK